LKSLFFLNSYGLMRQEINFFIVALIGLLISFLLAWRSGRRQLLFESLTALAISGLAVKMIRNLGLFGLSFAPLAVLYLKDAVHLTPGKRRLLSLLLIVAMLGLGVGLLNNSYYRWLGSAKRFGLASPSGATEAVDFIKQNNLRGPLFNNFDIGSFLIWKLYPQERVFVDGRPEAYSVEFFETIYKPMQAQPELWAEYAERYHINYVIFDHRDITPWARSFLQQMANNPAWPVVYLDQSAIIFVKNTPTNHSLIERFRTKSR